MMHALAYRLSAWLLVALLAVTGVVSAAHMAPNENDPARIAAALVTGDPDALCGTEHSGHAYHCPFCHKLPGPPQLSAPSIAERIAFAFPDLRGADLLSGPRHIGPHVCLRGPPARA